jgi:uncharacterized protein VirK/YbjX
MMTKTTKQIFLNLLNARKKCKFESGVDMKLIRNLILRSIVFLPDQIKLQKLYDKHHVSWILSDNISCYNRLYYPFITKNLKTKQKLEYMDKHLKVMFKFDKKMVSNLYNGLSVMIVDLSQFGINIQVKMKSDYNFKTEGDISFYLENIETGGTVYTITGIFSEDVFTIGGIQGNRGNKDLIKSLTKQYHGMRPQNLLLYCVMELCKTMGISNIHGIKKDSHSYKAKRKLRDRIKFNYNTFWSELGDFEDIGDFIKFSSTYSLKELSEIESKKRSMHKKRYELLGTISIEIEKKVAELLPTE